ncbi:MAG: single-stranded DNA-binding protein [Chloroflexota bacterium]|jgi:single-strand DNA-binding protein
MSLNKCMIIGNLGRDPEMRYTPSGQAVTQFSVATNRNYRDPQGEWQSEAEWFRVVVWGDQGERVAEYLRKGHKVYVEGRLQTRQWEDQSGNKRYTTELIANRVTSLERRDREGEPPFPAEAPGGFEGGSSSGAGAGGTGSSGAGAGGSSSGATGGTTTTTSSAEDYDDLPF